jgi:acetyl coenzyme A synthetase (ADP forming)-like protein
LLIKRRNKNLISPQPLRKENIVALKYLLYPRSVAIIGATSDIGKIGGILFTNIVKDGYSGRIYPVNVRRNEVLGFKCYKSVLDIPEEVDLAVIAIPAPQVPHVIEECGKKGVKAAVIISSGFAEAGEEGKVLQSEIVKLAKKYNIRILGPNSFGVINTTINLNAAFGLPIKGRGNIAFISQSGAILDGILGWAQDEGVYFNILVSLGNRADVDERELLLFMRDDPETKVIGIYIEGLPPIPAIGREFVMILEEVTKVKPVVILKGGRSKAGARGTLSHTASLAGDINIYKAAFKQGGALVAESLDEFIDFLKALSKQPRVKGRRIAIISNSGGLAILAADAAEKYGIEVPELRNELVERIKKVIPPFGNPYNPIDITAQGTPEQQYSMYAEVFKIVNNPQVVDAILIIVEGSFPRDLMVAIKEAIIKEIIPISKVPLVVNWFGAKSYVKDLVDEIENRGIPVYPTPERAINGLRAILSLSRIY